MEEGNVDKESQSTTSKINGQLNNSDNSNFQSTIDYQLQNFQSNLLSKRNYSLNQEDDE